MKVNMDYMALAFIPAAWLVYNIDGTFTEALIYGAGMWGGCYFLIRETAKNFREARMAVQKHGLRRCIRSLFKP